MASRFRNAGHRADRSGPGPVRIGYDNAKSSIGYRGTPLWPGIDWGFDALCTCTWAMSGGTYQVKVSDALCVTHAAVSRG